MRIFLIMTMIGGLLFAMACANAAEPVSIQKASNTVRSGPAAADSHNDDDAPRITLADAKKAFDSGEAIFIDTRDPGTYKQEHIKGAINVTNAMLATQYENIPKDKKIIAYCSWPKEHTSASLVSELIKKGTKNAYALVGGTQAWKNAGYPMESGGK